MTTFFQPPERPFHNINYTLTTACHHLVNQDQWGDKKFVPYLNKFYLFTEGDLSFQINDESFTATKGDILLLPLHTCQSYYANSTYFDHYYCHFLMSTDYHSLDLLDLIRCPYKLSLSDEDYAWFVNKMDELVTLYHGEVSYLQIMKCYDLFNRMIMTYVKKCGDEIRNIEPKAYLTQMLEVMDYIKQNTHRQITVEEMANVLHLHPNYFIRLFKKHYGMAPIKYINTVKIKMACEHLLQGEDSISYIATSLGYTDIYYFSKLFKKHTGMSPTEFRKKGELGY